MLQHLTGLPVWLVLTAVFGVPALEASAFVGFVFPGETVLLVGGVLASQGHVPLAAILPAGICGAVAGDAIGFVVGRRWGRRMLGATLGRLVQSDHLDRAEQALSRRGGWTVFIGRFTVTLRVLIPGLAGMAGMPYRTFATFNVAGAVLWGGLTVLAGYFAGASWHAVAHLLSGAGLGLAGVLVVAFVGSHLLRRRRSRSSALEVAEPGQAAEQVRSGRPVIRSLPLR